MKISALQPKSTIRHELKYAPRLFVILASRDCPDVKEMIQKSAEKRIADMRSGRSKQATLAELENDEIAVLKTAIRGIEDETGDGEPMAFTPENVDALLAVGWVRRDLDKALENEALFFES